MIAAFTQLKNVKILLVLFFNGNIKTKYDSFALFLFFKLYGPPKMTKLNHKDVLALV